MVNMALRWSLKSALPTASFHADAVVPLLIGCGGVGENSHGAVAACGLGVGPVCCRQPVGKLESVELAVQGRHGQMKDAVGVGSSTHDRVSRSGGNNQVNRRSNRRTGGRGGTLADYRSGGDGCIRGVRDGTD